MTDEQSIRDELIGLRLASYSKIMSDGYPSGIIRGNEEAADILLASPVIRRIQAEALRDAARAFATGGWIDTFTASVVDDVTAVQATDRWFNEAADRIERGETA